MQDSQSQINTSRIPSNLSWVATRRTTLERAPLLDLRSWSVGGREGALLLLVVCTGAVVGVGSDVAEREASPCWSSAIIAVLSTRGKRGWEGGGVLPFLL